MIQTPMTPEEFIAMTRQLEQKEGITLSGKQGTITKMGVTASYAYDGKILTVTILDKPFFVTTEYCEQQLRNWLPGSVKESA